MRIAILLLIIVSTLAANNMRHKSTVGEVQDLSNNVGVISSQVIEVNPPITKQQYQINKASKSTTRAIESALRHSQPAAFVQITQQNDVIDNIPFVEETLDQMVIEKPQEAYYNDGSSPDMGTSAEIEEASEAPMNNDNQENPIDEYYAQEQVYTDEVNEQSEVSLLQITEIDALANIDTSMPLFDEDVKIDEQALQETPLNIDVQDQTNETSNMDADLQRETEQMVEALSGDEDLMINEVQLIQVASVAERGFY